MKKKLLLLLIMLIPFFINAEEIKLNWQTSFGGNSTDVSYDFVVTSEDEIIVFGGSHSTDIEGLENKGGSDAILLKYDKNGNLLWKKNYGGSGHDRFDAVAIGQNDEMVTIGFTQSTDIEGLEHKGGQDALIVKYDKNGNLLWQKNYGGSSLENLNHIIINEHDEIIITGSTSSTDIDGIEIKGGSDAIVLKLDKNGNIIWQSSFGGNQNDTFNNVSITPQEEIIVTGYIQSTNIEGLPNKGLYDALIIKYDKDGNILWKSTVGGTKMDMFTKLELTNSGNIIVSGYTNSTDIEGIEPKGSTDVIIIKYDKNGKIIWKKSYGGNQGENLNYLYITENEEIVLSGYSNSTDIQGYNNKGDKDGIIVKYDKDGKLLWQNSFGGNLADQFNGIIGLQNDSQIIFGTTSSTDIDGLSNKEGQNIMIIKNNKEGNLLWKTSFGGSGYENIYNLFITQNGNILAITSSDSTDIDGITNNGSDDIVILNYSISYNIDLNENISYGTATAVQQGSKGIITLTPDKGYEVDQIIIKDSEGNILDVETTKLEDGTYSFPLYTDVIVEVTFKEKIENPKTGLLDYGAILILFMLLPILALIYICRYNQKYGL